MIMPLIQEMMYQDPVRVFSLFAEEVGAVFLDSAQLRSHCGRYSFIARDPFITLQSKNGMMTLNGQASEGDPFAVLTETLVQYPLQTAPDLPPFQGGIAGVFSYDLYAHLENTSRMPFDDMEFPDLAVGFYDVVIAFDHLKEKAWVFSSGYPLQDPLARQLRALERLNEIQIKLENIPPLSDFIPQYLDKSTIETNFTAEEYQASVKRIKEYILAGDIFQANFTQRFKAELPPDHKAFDLYRRLRALNPAPFAGYMQWHEMILASASPERFLKLTQRSIETRPIKGTRARGKNAEEDLQLANELLHSEKDHAENTMIVDLMRNDLSRVCDDHSVEVSQLCGLESYATVHHLVSNVQGQLQAHLNAIDLLKATFPGGSITGAPKIRAMEIIAELEPTRRGPYCGSMGYIGFNGDMDCSIIIRTYAIKQNKITFQAGGAVVVDSDPLAEYEESLTKAQALYDVLIGYDFTH